MWKRMPGPCSVVLAQARRRTSVVRFQFQSNCARSRQKCPAELVLRVQQKVVFKSADEDAVRCGLTEEAAASATEIMAEPRAYTRLPPR